MFCVCFQGTSTNFGIFIWMEKTTPRRRIHCCCTPNCWRWTNTLADARCIFVSSSGLSIVLFLNWANDIFYTLNLTLTETCLHFYMLEHYFGVFINHFSVNHWLVADLKFCYLCRDICTHIRTHNVGDVLIGSHETNLPWLSYCCPDCVLWRPVCR